MLRWLSAVFALGLLPVTAQPQVPARPVIVASKPFGESYILAEMFAQLLEAHGMRADRRLGLGATQIAYGALRTSAIDVYPEYTGTGLIAILGLPPEPNARAVFSEVAAASAARDSVRWLPPLGFENTYAVAVRRGTADSLHLETLSDLARAGAGLRGGFTADFIGRPDGLPGLVRVYGIHLRDARALLPAVKYEALNAGSVDVIDGFSTDGLIARYDLAVLRDDRHFYPPYEAAAVVSPALQRDNPAAIAVLTELSDRIGVTQMRAFNRRLEVDGVPVAVIAADALREIGLVPGVGAAAARREAPQGRAVTGREPLGLYLQSQRGALAAMTVRHLLLVAISLGAAILAAVPIGIGLAGIPRYADVVIRVIGAIQTVPGIALLAFMIPLLGIGVIPALVALFLYSLYPILRNTYEGVRGTEPGAVGAGQALGMTDGQVMAYIRLPLAMPVIMAGVRTAAVIDVGTATLAAFIGAGGLGDAIVTGLALSDTRMILSGAIPAALLALAVDALLGAGQRLAARRWNAA
jgi:osmoprotectant transport system permease protein